MATNNRKSAIRFSKALVQFICDKIAEGNDLSAVCNKYKSKCPTPNTVSKWKKKFPDIEPMFRAAYREFIYRKMEELDYISKTDARILYPDIDDFRERAEARRARLDGLKFMIAKMGPMIADGFEAKAKVEHSGKIDTPSIVVHNYSIDPPKVNRTIEHDEDK